jgi:hypothetical protein
MGLVHHDVSLGNIVVLYNGQVKLVDFGVARASQHAGSLKVHGKIGYMAPEKLRGKPGDRRSDVWSLGVVLWEALTLRRLFRGNSERETAQMVCDFEIPLPSTVNADVPVDCDPIVMRALERDPDKRYATAKELSDDLETLLAAHQYGRQNKIATYMQATFAEHMVARRNLMKEVATRGFASADVLDAAFDEKHSIPGEVEIRFKRKTDSPLARRSLVTEVPIADGTPIQAVDEIVERRRRNSFAMVAEGTPHSQITPLPDLLAQHIPVAQVVEDEPAVIRSQVPRDGDEPPPPAIDPDLIREQPTAELAPEVLDALARKSARINTPTGIEALRTEVSIQPIPDEEPVRALEVPVEPRSASFAILLALGVMLAAILGFFVMKYL